MGDKGVTAIADMLKTNSTLTTINLNCEFWNHSLTYPVNQIGDEGSTAIADMLKTNSTLTSIHLRGE